MPRQLRIQYPGAMYHVMNRGDERQDIFKDDQDRQQFLGTLDQACSQADLIALDSAISHATGTQGLSASADQMYADLDRGDQAYADLDAIDAALELSGCSGAAAITAWASSQRPARHMGAIFSR